VQEGWTYFKQELLKAQELAVPMCRKGSWRGRRPAWMNKELLKELGEKKRVYRLWKEGKASPDMFRDVARLCRRRIREAKAQLELKLATSVKDNKKHFYKFINAKKKGKKSLHSLLDLEGNIITEDEEKAEVLNAFFASIFNSEEGGVQDEWTLELGDAVGEQCVPLEIHEELVQDLLSHLDTHKSMGPDGIHPRVLRELADELAKPLSIIFHQSWLTGEVPDDWKLANVIPIHKKGRMEEPGNYRPVSLTSVPGKMMEQFILGAITAHLKDAQGLRSSQHGFRQGRSCLSNLISFYDQVTRLVDVGRPVDVVYLDFSKAFDTVPHSKLLAKLSARGLDGNTLRW
ncbi:RTXE polymerase, partial [Picathartes gymnocephalus]|nr:RTXE polymerase [Picathartes gymnocephalus]